MGHTIKLVEDATANAINRLASPTLNGIVINPNQEKVQPFMVNLPVMSSKSTCLNYRNCRKLDALITINAIPGFFCHRSAFVLYRYKRHNHRAGFQHMRKAFVIGDMRYFDEDPRFGLITLALQVVLCLLLSMTLVRQYK
jgi:uncharacterized membrane protein